MTIATPERAMAIRANLRLRDRQQAAASRQLDICTWLERYHYDPETKAPIRLAPHQRALLRLALTPDAEGSLPYQTIVYSCPKKSGKTALAGGVAGWFAETRGRGEIYCLANDYEQAQGRVYQSLADSLALRPGYDVQRRAIPGQWRVLDREATHWPTGTKVKASASDYKGQAGANPTLTLWSELWGYSSEQARRLYEEMTPVPTRRNSIRWIETYAGFDDESDLLWSLYEQAMAGRQLMASELPGYAEGPPAFAECPNAGDPVPVWVTGLLLCYWDSGDQGRRMPWQRGPKAEAYYAEQAISLRPAQFDRLHRNLWVSPESSFVPMPLWDRCRVDWLPDIGPDTPCVLALDAAVSGDCFGVVLTSRHRDRADGVAVQYSRKFDPPKGGSIDYGPVEELVRAICGRYRVGEVAYDPYQLHDMATRLGQEGVAWFRPFDQGQGRLFADKLLYDLIVSGRLAHNGDPDLTKHIANANAQVGINEDSKLRIVKKADNRKIDLAVALSMSSAECLRLAI